jgi:hypothetical protein
MQNGDHYIYGIGGYDGTNISEALTLQEVINELNNKENPTIDHLATKEEVTNEVNILNTRIDNISSEINTYTAGTNVEITDNTINVIGYTYDSELNAFSSGKNAQASGSGSFAEGTRTKAEGSHSHAEGFNTKATNTHAHAEGSNTTASGHTSHAEGL